MTVREAIRRAVPVFAANPGSGPDVLGLAVAVRATARFSLGSVSSDIELIERLLSSPA